MANSRSMSFQFTLFWKIVVALGFLFSHSAPAFAQADSGNITVKVNGNVLLFEQPPAIVNGTTLVPMRAIFEAMGASVDWDSRLKTAVAAKGSKRIVLKIGSRFPEINGSFMELEQPAQVINGYTMAPLRFVSESLGARVDWDGATKTITITNGTPPAVTKLSAPPFGLSGKEEWKTFSTKYFQIYYTGEDQDVLHYSEEFDSIYDQAVNVFAQQPKRKDHDRIPAVMLNNNDYRSTASVPWSIAYWDTQQCAMFMNFEEIIKKKDLLYIYQAFRHELTHAITLSSEKSGLKNPPMWFIEGVATFHEPDPPYFGTSRDSTLLNAVKTGTRLLSWHEITYEDYKSWTDEKVYLAYAESQSIWTYLAEIYGDANLNRLFYTDTDFNKAMTELTNKTLEELERDWLAYVDKRSHLRNGRVWVRDAIGNLLYDGYFKDDLYDGYGELYEKDSTYYGQFKAGKKSGYGRLYQYPSLLYEGNFKDDLYDGQGIRYYSDGMYVGQFAQGKRSGKGKFYDKAGNLQYEGQYANDKREGAGKVYVNGSLYYEGEWKADLHDGQGKRYYSDGMYFGQFSQGKRSGNGKLYLSDGTLQYEGEWKDNLYDGQGIRYYSYGKYVGQFSQGKRSGNGKFYDKADNLQYEGEYNNDMRNGYGILYNKDGSVSFEGNFRNDRKVINSEDK